MANEYFSHDYDASNDPELAAMIGEFKASGYGIFWRIVEMLHKEGGYLPLTQVSYVAIARSLESDPELVKDIINKGISIYGLFVVKKNKFTIRRVLKNLKKRGEIKRVRSKAGHASASKRQQNLTHVEDVLTHVEQNSTKERKLKERKEREGKRVFHPPTQPQVEQFIETDLNKDQFTAAGIAGKFFNHYASVGWKVGRNPMKDWKAAARKWVSNERNFVNGQQSTQPNKTYKTI